MSPRNLRELVASSFKDIASKDKKKVFLSSILFLKSITLSRVLKQKSTARSAVNYLWDHILLSRYSRIVFWSDNTDCFITENIDQPTSKLKSWKLPFNSSRKELRLSIDDQYRDVEVWESYWRVVFNICWPKQKPHFFNKNRFDTKAHLF